MRDGTPQIALPLDLPTDGHKRYKIGTIRVKEPSVPGVEIKTPENAPLSTMDYDASRQKIQVVNRPAQTTQRATNKNTNRTPNGARFFV